MADIEWLDDDETPEVKPAAPRPPPRPRVGEESRLASGALVDRVRANWRDVSVSTAPLDRDALVAATAALYRASGLKRAPEALWADSPKAGLTLALEVMKRSSAVRRTLWHQAHLEAARQVEERVEEPLRRRVTKLFEDNFGLVCRQLVTSALEAETGQRMLRLPACWGHHEAGALATYDLFARGGLRLPRAEALAQQGRLAGWWWPFEDACVFVERPTRVERDDEGRLHCEERLALEYRDGCGVYAFQGVRVSPEFLFAPHTMDPAAILAERNMEVRRVMIERFGIKRLVETTRAEVLDEDKHRTLYRLRLSGDEPIVAVRVTCPSTGHVYLLRVPPEIRSCRAAVAWTFELSETEYAPVAES